MNFALMKVSLLPCGLTHTHTVFVLLFSFLSLFSLSVDSHHYSPGWAFDSTVIFVIYLNPFSQLSTCYHQEFICQFISFLVFLYFFPLGIVLLFCHPLFSTQIQPISLQRSTAQAGQQKRYFNNQLDLLQMFNERPT